MKNYSVVTNPVEFRNQFFSQTQDCLSDKTYSTIINIFLYYFWRGAFESRKAFLQKNIQSDLGLISLSIYLSYLPILQTARLGYISDAMVLSRALLEKISIFGYLSENQDQIPRYLNGKSRLQQKAMAWLKDSGEGIHMGVYGDLSKMAHPYLPGLSGNLMSHNRIGEAFRQNISDNKNPGLDITIIFGFFVYSLQVVDTIFSKLVPEIDMKVMGNDKKILIYFRKDELKIFMDFLLNFSDLIID